MSLPWFRTVNSSSSAYNRFLKRSLCSGCIHDQPEQASQDIQLHHSCTGWCPIRHSLKQHRVKPFYREDYCSPWGKKAQTGHSHRQYFWSSFLDSHGAPHEKDLLLWAVQGCQDHHNEIKQVSANPSHQYSPPAFPDILHQPPKCSSVLVHFKSEQRASLRQQNRWQLITAGISSAAPSMHKSIMVRHEENEDMALRVFFRGRGQLVEDERTSWLAKMWQLTPQRLCINMRDTHGNTDAMTGCRSCFGSHWSSGHPHCKQHRETDEQNTDSSLRFNLKYQV